MLMLTAFFPFVNAYMPSGFKHTFWLVLWIGFLILFYPNILKNKLILLNIAYLIFLFLSLNTYWENMLVREKERLISESIHIFAAVTIVVYFHHVRDYLLFAKLTFVVIIFLFITALLTIYSASIDPLFLRNITSSQSEYSQIDDETIQYFRSLGGANYGIAGTFMSLFPVMIYFYKRNHLFLKRKYIIIYGSIIIFALVSTQLFTNLIIAIFTFIVSIFGVKKLKKSLLIILFLSIIFSLIPRSFYVNTFIVLSDVFRNQKEISYKFRDVAQFIELRASIEEETTGTGIRAKRFPKLMESFVRSPLLGCFYNTSETGHDYYLLGYHIYWANKLTTTGIIGILFFTLVLYVFIKISLPKFEESYKFYFLIMTFSILAYGIFKAIAGREFWYSFFILSNGFYYLPLINKKEDSKTEIQEK